MSSILNDVKKHIGPSALYSVFDDEIIMHINTVFFELDQLGIGSDKPYVIEDKSDEWEDFIDVEKLSAVKTYVCLQCRMYFDPPTNGTLISAINDQLKKLEWRLNVAVDPDDDVVEEQSCL